MLIYVNINITYHDYAGDYTESESYAREYVVKVIIITT